MTSINANAFCVQSARVFVCVCVRVWLQDFSAGRIHARKSAFEVAVAPGSAQTKIVCVHQTQRGLQAQFGRFFFSGAGLG